MVKIHAREGLQLHHVFFLERVMVALKKAYSCSTVQYVCTYRLPNANSNPNLSPFTDSNSNSNPIPVQVQFQFQYQCQF